MLKNHFSGLGDVGEHIYAWPGQLSQGDIRRRVEGWFDEVTDFTYPNRCSGQCGHYVGVSNMPNSFRIFSRGI